MYNRLQRKKSPGMFDQLRILNLHLRLWDSYIGDWMSSRHYAAEGRRDPAVTHLASARRQKGATAFRGKENSESHAYGSLYFT